MKSTLLYISNLVNVPHGPSLNDAYRCVELSRLAYQDAVEGERLARGELGYTSFRHIEVGRAHVALVVEDACHTFIAFRGTRRMINWMTNLKAWTRPCEFGRVHAGCLDACESLLAPLMRHLDEHPLTKPVYLTGHSMGGAMAVVMALFLHRYLADMAGIYTFGQPQIGDRAFKQTFEAIIDAPFYRFVHGTDAIAAWSYGPHTDLGYRCYFDVRGRLVSGRRLREMPRLGTRLHRLDHYRYFLNLNRLREREMQGNDDETLIQ